MNKQHNVRSSLFIRQVFLYHFSLKIFQNKINAVKPLNNTDIQ